MSTKRPIFLLLGGNVLNQGIVAKFQKLGWRVMVVDWNEHPNLTGDAHYRIDVKNAPAIIEALRKTRVLGELGFAYSSIDLAVGSVAVINKIIGLNVLTDEALQRVTSKGAMTACWREAGLLNRVSMSFDAYESSIEKFAQAMDSIFKPDNSASSRGITMVRAGADPVQVRAAFDKAQAEATNGRVVVEEFVTGTEYTVEMLGDGDGRVAVYAISKKAHTVNTRQNKIAVKLHYNVLPLSHQQRIAAFGARCYRALGLSNSLGHLEILEKQDGSFSPVEIGARSSGFIASDLVDAASGKEYLKDLIAVQRGERVVDGMVAETGICSMYYFYDLPAGQVIKTKRSLRDFLPTSIASRFSDNGKLLPGFCVPLLADDNQRLGFEVLVGPKNIMTEACIRQAENKLLEALFHE